MNKFYLILVVALMFVFSPVFSYAQGNDNISTQEKKSNDKSDIVCTQDAKLCSDGSFVTRSGDDCQFAKCPGKEAEQEQYQKKEKGEKELPSAADNLKENEKESSEKVEKSANSKKDEMENDENGCVGNDGKIASTTDCLNADKDNDKDQNDDFMKRAEQRKSQIANAVQELVSVAQKIKTNVGEQIKTIAQEQEKNYQDAEDAVKTVSERGVFARFFIGPNYSEINKAEKYAKQYTEKLQEMQKTVTKITATDVVNVLDSQIQKMQQVKEELKKEINKQKGGFSLFGWLNRLFAK